VLAAVPGRDDEFALRDRPAQLAAMAWREQHMLEGLGRRLRRATRGEDAFGAFVDAQDHVVATAVAHVERVVLESAARRIARVRAAAVRRTLERVCDLHALSRIERDRGWFLEHGHLSPGRAKGVVRLVNDACADIRPLAEDLVDAFSIPDPVLGAPIGTGAATG
jgi:acyl-CoA oxidase